MKKITLMLSALFILTLGPALAAPKTTTKASSVSSKMASMQKVLRVWVFEKGGDFVGDVGGIFDQKRKVVILKCGLKNQTKKNIRGVRGVLRFTTLFGEYLCDLSLETTAAVPAGQSVSVEWKVGSERFTEEALKKFEKLKLEEMRQLWYPTTIAFTDGTILK
jgi:hypothetical protein